jgi:ubiquitin-conjugating enzyme E2 J1
MYSAGPVDNELFHWHFTLRGPPDTNFEEGLYHGRIEFSYDYPFKPPDIYFLTPNGRYETNTKICLSITTYHPEEWKPAWTARAMLEALISTFPEKDDKIMGVGGLNVFSDEHLKALAHRSRSWACEKCGPIAALMIDKAEEEKEAEARNSEKKSAGGQNGEEEQKEGSDPQSKAAALEKENLAQAQLETKRQQVQQLQRSVSSMIQTPGVRPLLQPQQRAAERPDSQQPARRETHPINFASIFQNLNEYQTAAESIKF